MPSIEPRIYLYTDRYGNDRVIFNDVIKFLGIDARMKPIVFKLLITKYPKLFVRMHVISGISVDLSGQYSKKLRGRFLLADANVLYNPAIYSDLINIVAKAKNSNQIIERISLLKKYIDQFDNNSPNSFIKSTLNNLQTSLKEFFNTILLANGISNSTDRHRIIEFVNNFIDDKINLTIAKISKAILTATQSRISNPSEVNSVDIDSTDRIIEESGIKFVLSNGYKMPLVTAEPDKDKFFTIGDFLREKGYSLLYSREFGFYFSKIARQNGIKVLKYLPYATSNPKSGLNYYSRSDYGFVNKVFNLWLSTTKTAVVVDKRRLG